MSKQPEQALLLPGPLGWETWKRLQDGRYERTSSEDGPLKLGELTSLPNGDLVMLFPVKAFHAMPFRAASTDEALFEDLATMHAERLGIRPDPMAGKLSDLFEVEREEESTVLLDVVLKTPSEGELPQRTPKEFDLSPRVFPVDGDAISVWKELGRWVFAIHSQGKLLYCQGTSSSGPAPDHEVIQEIRLALSQLGLQGLALKPTALNYWPPEGELGDPGLLADAFEVAPTVAHRPDPVLPAQMSDLLPDDVRAARAQRKERNQKVILGSLAALVYLGLIGWFAYGYWQKAREVKALKREVAVAKSAGGEVVAEHNRRWDALAPVVESRLNPMEVMSSIHGAIPRNSGLRLTTADINFANKEIQISGNAPASAPVTTFYASIKRNPTLSWLEWQEEPPTNTAKGWDFRIKAELPKQTEY